MARPKREIDSDLAKEMQKRALEWSTFRTDNLLSQKYLADIIGVSRRTIQHVEAGNLIPQAATIKKFKDLQAKYGREGKPTGNKAKVA